MATMKSGDVTRLSTADIRELIDLVTFCGRVISPTVHQNSDTFAVADLKVELARREDEGEDDDDG